MKTIEIDDELYRYLLSKIQNFGETPSETIRRLIGSRMQSDGRVAASTTPQTSTPTNGQSSGESEIARFIDTPVFRSHRQAVDKFLSILSWLYQRDAEKFKLEALQIGGRTRKYFALDEQVLIQSGNSVNPKLIPGAKVWVVTNNDTPKKRDIVRDLMTALGFSNGAIQLMEHAIA